jgi:hypothetical protein
VCIGRRSINCANTSFPSYMAGSRLPYGTAKLAGVGNRVQVDDTPLSHGLQCRFNDLQS